MGEDSGLHPSLSFAERLGKCGGREGGRVTEFKGSIVE